MTRIRAVVLVGALLCAACGGGDDEGGQARTVEATTTTEGDTPTSTSTTAATPDVALAQIVVQLTDLPTGWSVSPPDDDEEDDDTFCEDMDPFNEIPPQEEAESSFQQSDFGPFAASGASRYADDDEASSVMDLLTEMANKCQTFTETDEDGTETSYTITPLSFPNLGDDTFAFRMAGATPFGPINIDIASVRQGEIVISLVNGGLGQVDSALTETLTRKMHDRL